MSNSRNSNFLTKLYELATSESYTKICSFNDDGDALVIHDVRTLEKEALSKFFNHGNYNSFVRQLNQYGFHKVREISATEFAHKYFKKGRMDLLELIERKPSRTNKSRTKDVPSSSSVPSEKPPLPSPPRPQNSEGPLTMSSGSGGETAPPSAPTYGDSFSSGVQRLPHAFLRDEEMDRLIQANWDLHLEIRVLKTRLRHAEDMIHGRYAVTAPSAPSYHGDGGAPSRFSSHHDRHDGFMRPEHYGFGERKHGISYEDIITAGRGYNGSGGAPPPHQPPSGISICAHAYGSESGSGAPHHPDAAAWAPPGKRSRQEAFGSNPIDVTNLSNFSLKSWKEMRARFPGDYTEGEKREERPVGCEEQPPPQTYYEAMAGSSATGQPGSMRPKLGAPVGPERCAMHPSSSNYIMKSKASSIEMLDFLSNIGV